MKKVGTVNICKIYPYNSMSYKLEKLNESKQNFNNSLIRIICISPYATYFYITLGNKYGIGYLITGVALHALLLALDIRILKKSIKEEKEIKNDIAKHLSKIEPKIISNEDDIQELVKRI